MGSSTNAGNLINEVLCVIFGLGQDLNHDELAIIGLLSSGSVVEYKLFDILFAFLVLIVQSRLFSDVEDDGGLYNYTNKTKRYPCSVEYVTTVPPFQSKRKMERAEKSRGFAYYYMLLKIGNPIRSCKNLQTITSNRNSDYALKTRPIRHSYCRSGCPRTTGSKTHPSASGSSNLTIGIFARLSKFRAAVSVAGTAILPLHGPVLLSPSTDASLAAAVVQMFRSLVVLKSKAVLIRSCGHMFDNHLLRCGVFGRCYR
ncbi:hypothetical protein PHJA_001887200 [Phtheirospermum japonicum]|uniref:Uncharacterized protein n=1 Tax=Phtheirospermum japonicum TaxID=374723 RepID=A0A830CSV9_9LAMI|nr:hypothetical protein PHJA_001887200 [Phtheirospermum japonicum]